MRDSIEQAKAIIGDARPYLESNGVEFTREGKFRCPTPKHADHNPSASINRSDPQRWKCWACGARGDVLDLYAMHHAISIGEAFKRIVEPGTANPAKLYKKRTQPRTRPHPTPPPRIEGEEMLYMQECSDRLYTSPDKILEFARWGKWKAPTIRRLSEERSLGVDEKGRLSFLYFTGVKHRNPEGAKDKVISRKGFKHCLWRMDALKLANPRQVIIAEGETDAITAIDDHESDWYRGECSGGYDIDMLVVALPCAGYRISWELPLFKGKDILFLVDDDPAGEVSVQENMRAVEPYAGRVRFRRCING